MGRGEAVTGTTGHPAYYRSRCKNIPAGANPYDIIFDDAGAAKVGKAYGQHQHYNKYCALLFISPEAKNNNKQVKRYPEFRITHQRHYPVEEGVGQAVVNKVKKVPVKI